MEMIHLPDGVPHEFGHLYLQPITMDTRVPDWDRDMLEIINHMQEEVATYLEAMASLKRMNPLFTFDSRSILDGFYKMAVIRVQALVGESRPESSATIETALRNAVDITTKQGRKYLGDQSNVLELLLDNVERQISEARDRQPGGVRSYFGEFYQRTTLYPILYLNYRVGANFLILDYWTRSFSAEILNNSGEPILHGIGGFVLSYVVAQYPNVEYVFMVPLRSTQKLLEKYRIHYEPIEKYPPAVKDLIPDGDYKGFYVIQRDVQKLLVLWKRWIATTSKKQKRCVGCGITDPGYHVEQMHHLLYCGEQCYQDNQNPLHI